MNFCRNVACPHPAITKVERDFGAMLRKLGTKRGKRMLIEINHTSDILG